MKKKLLCITAVVTACILLFAGCDLFGGDDSSSDKPKGGSITISATGNVSSIEKGNILRLSANVENVTWNIITSDVHDQTTISNNGLLTVSILETKTSLTVRAASITEPGKYGDKVLTVSEPAATGVVQCAVTFNLNGGSGTAPTQAPVAEGASITLPAGTGLTKGGFAFINWNSLADGSGAVYAAGSSVTITGDVEFFAIYQSSSTVFYTVSYNANGGAGAPAAVTNVPEGTTITLATGTGMTKDGFTFGGWLEDDPSDAFVLAGGSSYIVEDNVTLYAFWISTTATKYNVTFNIGSGTGTVPTQTPVPAGTTIILPDSSGFSRSKYSFTGWTDSITSTTYAANDPYQVIADVTFTAKWAIAKVQVTRTVSFDINGGTGTAPASMSGRVMTIITLPDNTGFSRSGYTFAGWNTEADGSGDLYESGDSYIISGTITLYADWDRAGIVRPPKKLYYTVTFDVGSGSGTAPDPVKVERGTPTILPDGTGMSKTLYTFDGWNTESDGSGTAYASGASYTPTASGTLYAQWTRIKIKNPVIIGP